MALGLTTLLIVCVVSFTMVHGDQSNLVQPNVCPYNDLCTRNRTKDIDVSSSFKPCCPKCYCDTTCFKLRDCCPDVDMTSLSVTESGVLPVCLPPFHCAESTDANRATTGVYQIRSCPSSYVAKNTDPEREEIKQKCEGSGPFEDLDEFLLVTSRTDHTEVFRNRYCAVCNGANDTIEWNLKIHDCNPGVSLIGNRRPSLEFLPEYLMFNCCLESVPPGELDTLERIQCPLKRPDDNTCNPHSDWFSSNQGDKVKDACERSSFEQAFFDYDPAQNLIAEYASYKCYLCENGPDSTPSDVCMDDADMDLVPNNTLTVLLTGSRILDLSPTDTDLSPTDTLENQIDLLFNASDQCLDDELYDERLDECVLLSCPRHTYAVGQHCAPIGQSMFGVDVLLQIGFAIVSRVKSPDHTTGTHRAMSDRVAFDELAARLGITEFKVFEYALTFFNDVTDDRELFVTLEYNLPTSRERPLDHTINVVRGLMDEVIEWRLNWQGHNYHLKGSVSFIDEYSFYNVTYPYSNLYQYEALWNFFPPAILRGLYICQHVLYKVEMYCPLLESLFSTPCPRDVQAFNVDSKLMKGFFVLDPESFGICTDTLEQYIRAAIQSDTGSIPVLLDQVVAQTDTAHSTGSQVAYFSAYLRFVVLPTLMIITILRG